MDYVSSKFMLRRQEQLEYGPNHLYSADCQVIAIASAHALKRDTLRERQESNERVKRDYRLDK